MQPITVTVGPLASASANNICLSQSPTAAAGFTINGALASGGVATLDTARRVLFTFSGNETGHTITLTGTNGAGQSQSESIEGTTAGTVYSVLDYKTVTVIGISANSTGAITVGTNTIASSRWVRLDGWAAGNIAIQCTASGTVNYTVQQTLDDPNSATSPVSASAVTWVSSSDTSAVGATGTIQTNYLFCPVYSRIFLNSGSGTVTATWQQSGNANL